MELLDRYLHAIKKHLPWQRQDDIIAELRANLESQLEDKEAELGRPLTSTEVEAWLKELGPPMQVAGRYQTQQYLIGPGLFPTYWYVLRMAMGWALTIYLIVTGVELIGKAPSGTAVLGAVLRVPGVLVTVAAWITLVFAAMEWAVTHCPSKFPAVMRPSADWSPSALPPVEMQPAGAKRRSYSQAVAEVIFGFLALIWLLLIPQHPYLLFGPGAPYLQSLPYRLAPVWMQFFWCLVALNLVQLWWNCADLWRGTWRGPRLAQKTVLGALGLIPLALLLTVRDHVLVVLKNPMLDQAKYGATLNSINHWIYVYGLFIFAIAALGLLWEVGRLSLDAFRKRAAAAR
jgi:hypothetical protein